MDRVFREMLKRFMNLTEQTGYYQEYRQVIVIR